MLIIGTPWFASACESDADELALYTRVVIFSTYKETSPGFMGESIH